MRNVRQVTGCGEPRKYTRKKVIPAGMTFSSAPISTSRAGGGGDGILTKTVEFFGDPRSDLGVVPGEQPIPW